ncbi:tryptophan 7-halogenase [Aestuariibacter halophilus]|uniref:Tryptophan 7-halogenase n=1 Tax=Fluctibacter halophilus TaxID=226011 RepID=A0ABS8G7B0_9ALTE|nr:tryptophan halogenase family protein [Aestuariibacter halophilus]MCC2616308.1 tryptophan 7-halogenase [Aestuariibacter halophilus]
MNNQPTHLVIVGGGTAGWMTANLLAHQWGKLGMRISLIESHKIGTVGVGEGSTPYLKEFFERLAIPESEWMPACNATYKCGISFPGWSEKPGYDSYFHPFYSDLDGPQAQAFFRQCNEKRHGGSNHAHPNDYFLASALTRQSRAPISNEIPASDLVYAYHFDAELLGQFLRQHALKLGVQLIEDKVTDIQCNQRGQIAILNTESSGPVRGDFFVDCSGFKGLLVQQTLGEKQQSYRPYLFNDSAVAIQTPLDERDPIQPHTVSKALTHGWVWHIPLSNRYGNGYVYSSKYCSAEQAEQELRELLGPGATDAKALHLKWEPGRISQHWKKNCVAIGLSQGFLEPLEAPMLFVVQRTIEHFIGCYEQGGFSDVKRNEFNQEINKIIDGTRDYLQAHYLMNSRSDSDYWRDCRDNPQQSEALSDIIAAWRATGNFDLALHKHQDKLAYLKTSWYCLLAGKGGFENTFELDSHPPERQWCDNKARSFIFHREHLSRFHADMPWPSPLKDY